MRGPVAGISAHPETGSQNAASMSTPETKKFRSGFHSRRTSHLGTVPGLSTATKISVGATHAIARSATAAGRRVRRLAPGAAGGRALRERDRPGRAARPGLLRRRQDHAVLGEWSGAKGTRPGTRAGLPVPRLTDGQSGRIAERNDTQIQNAKSAHPCQSFGCTKFRDIS